MDITLTGFRKTRRPMKVLFDKENTVKDILEIIKDHLGPEFSPELVFTCQPLRYHAGVTSDLFSLKVQIKDEEKLEDKKEEPSPELPAAQLTQINKLRRLTERREELMKDFALLTGINPKRLTYLQFIIRCRDKTPYWCKEHLNAYDNLCKISEEISYLDDTIKQSVKQ